MLLIYRRKWAENPTVYSLEIEAKLDFPFQVEQLLVNDINVISIQGENRVVRDENNENETTYNSNKLALGSAGNYGEKPITRALTEFIKEWQFYNFDIDFIRGSLKEFSPTEEKIGESPKLDRYGRQLPEVLWDWHKNSLESFQNVSDALASSTNFEIDQCLIDGQYQLCLLEGYKNPIPLEGASDGTLRLVAYNILLNEPELQSFIAIEEPEQNLHPGVLTDIANVLEQIAQYSQVIITTHSSQLLGAFNPENLGDSLGFYCYATVQVSAQRCSTLRITAVKRRHLMVGLQISVSVVPSLIVDSCQMKWRIQPNAKHKNLDFRVRQRCKGSQVFGK